MKLRVSEGAPPGRYREGLADILVMDGVFYNDMAKLSRDVAVAVTAAHGEIAGSRSMLLCEPLAATGVRAIRIAKESGVLGRACVNDFSKAAYRNLLENVRRNGLEAMFSVSNEDANLHLLKHAWGSRPDIIDVDPFGSPAPYIDSAVQAIRNGGLLAVTATDVAPLCAVHGKSALRRYHSVPIKTSYCKELAVRIVIGFVARVAATHDLGVKPILAHATRHYLRAYMVVYRGTSWANRSIGNIGFVDHCPRCLRRRVSAGLNPPSEQCLCGSQMIRAGPLWIGPMVDPVYAERALEKALALGLTEASKLLRTLRGEAFPAVGYYQLDELASIHRYSSPPVGKVVELLREWGYRASRTHFDPKGVRTDAPYEDVVRAIDVLSDSKQDVSKQEG